MLNQKKYSEIAKHCSSYSCKECGYQNSSMEENKSCTSCKHFMATNEKCDLNLIDPIVKNHSIQLDFFFLRGATFFPAKTAIDRGPITQEGFVFDIVFFSFWEASVSESKTSFHSISVSITGK